MNIEMITEDVRNNWPLYALGVAVLYLQIRVAWLRCKCRSLQNDCTAWEQKLYYNTKPEARTVDPLPVQIMREYQKGVSSVLGSISSESDEAAIIKEYNEGVKWMLGNAGIPQDSLPLEKQP